jgi:hypothetical protein
VSTFYLMPPRPQVGERFVGYLKDLFPGLDWSRTTWPDLAEVLTGLASRRGDVFVVHREDLPAGEATARALADGFGAEAGDEIVEVRPGSRPGELTAHRWRLGDV